MPIAIHKIVIESPSFKPSFGWTAGGSAYAGTMGSVQAEKGIFKIDFHVWYTTKNWFPITNKVPGAGQVVQLMIKSIIYIIGSY